MAAIPKRKTQTTAGPALKPVNDDVIIISDSTQKSRSSRAQVKAPPQQMIEVLEISSGPQQAPLQPPPANSITGRRKQSPMASEKTDKAPNMQRLAATSRSRSSSRSRSRSRSVFESGIKTLAKPAASGRNDMASRATPPASSRGINAYTYRTVRTPGPAWTRATFQSQSRSRSRSRSPPAASKMKSSARMTWTTLPFSKPEPTLAPATTSRSRSRSRSPPVPHTKQGARVPWTTLPFSTPTLMRKKNHGQVNAAVEPMPSELRARRSRSRSPAETKTPSPKPASGPPVVDISPASGRVQEHQRGGSGRATKTTARSGRGPSSPSAASTFSRTSSTRGTIVYPNIVNTPLLPKTRIPCIAADVAQRIWIASLPSTHGSAHQPRPSVQVSSCGHVAVHSPGSGAPAKILSYQSVDEKDFREVFRVQIPLYDDALVATRTASSPEAYGHIFLKVWASPLPTSSSSLSSPPKPPLLSHFQREDMEHLTHQDHRLTAEFNMYRYITTHILQTGQSFNFVPLLTTTLTPCSAAALKEAHATLAGNMVQDVRTRNLTSHVQFKLLATPASTTVRTLQFFLNYTKLQSMADVQAEVAAVVFQLFHALFVLTLHVLNHGDLHAKNVLVDFLPHPITLEYTIGGRRVAFTTSYLVKMYDWDLAHGRHNPFPVNSSTDRVVFNARKDFYQLLCTLGQYPMLHAFLAEVLQLSPEHRSALFRDMPSKATPAPGQNGEMIGGQYRVPLSGASVKAIATRSATHTRRPDKYYNMSIQRLRSLLQPADFERLKTQMPASEFSLMSHIYFHLDEAHGQLTVPRGWYCEMRNQFRPELVPSINSFFLTDSGWARITRHLARVPEGHSGTKGVLLRSVLPTPVRDTASAAP